MFRNPFAILRQKRDDRLRKIALDHAITCCLKGCLDGSLETIANRCYVLLTAGDPAPQPANDNTGAFLGIYG